MKLRTDFNIAGHFNLIAASLEMDSNIRAHWDRQEVCKKQLFDTGSNFRAKASRPPPSLSPLLYAVHNSHNQCGKYLFLAVHIQIYLNFIIFSCLLEWWVNMLGPEPLTIHWMTVATSLIGKWGITAHMWCMDGAKSICRVYKFWVCRLPLMKLIIVLECAPLAMHTVLSATPLC
jgi:hypothetical protein